MGILTVGGPEVVYGYAETVAITSGANSTLSARRAGGWVLDVSADTSLSFAEAGSRAES